MTVRIPLAKPEITDADGEAVMQVLRTPCLSTGPKVAEFERAICGYTGAKHAVAVNSGTSALQLAIRALGIEPGSEVILPSFTFSAVLNVILLEGLRPKFVDIDPCTFNCTAEAMLAAVSDETRLIIAVHTFGFPVDVSAVVDGLTCQSGKNKICVIEDACEALGADVGGRKAGTLADAGLFAFYPNKQITTGEGGMLVTSDQALARKAAQLRNQGRDPALGWNSHAEIGFSYRISDINCALGISQLTRVAGVIARRQELAEVYDRELSNIPEIVRPPLTSDRGRISWFVYPIQLAAEFTTADRDRICESMLQEGIATGRYFAPLHRQPVLVSSSAARDSSPRGSTTKDTKANEATKGEHAWSLSTLRSSTVDGIDENPAVQRETIESEIKFPADTTDTPAAQRRHIDSPARECRESVLHPNRVRFSGRHNLPDEQHLPNTEFIADRVIQLPFFNELTEREIREVCAALKHAIHELRRNT